MTESHTPRAEVLGAMLLLPQCMDGVKGQEIVSGAPAGPLL
eukprot:CAMPEP_0182909552 /NCGR_PEP_ID=MMETSP0034_2-20130328/35819_1 /TAXON_ID=156128 /ORGANISM="Nephroselmis pyriformis, Strain CCMP717" /LENGTH=40 /DNA_ID= /DNA_START= /DNA_END= /DNA_ORIENTATION=